LKSLTHSGPRAVSGDSRCSSWSLLATTRSLPQGSHAQARCGVTAAVAGAAVTAPGAAGLTIWAEVTAADGAGAAAAGAASAGAADCAVAAAAACAAAAEPAPVENLCRQASRLILLLSLSGRFLLFLGVTLAAAAAGVAVLQFRLVSTLPPSVLYTSLAAMPFATHVLNISYRMVAGGGACCLLAGLEGGGGSTVAAAAADRSPLLAPGGCGVG
jgi:hypothetical protein